MPRVEWLEALADPIRLGIVRYLARNGSAARGELAKAVSAAPETVRRHLVSLESAGVVELLPPEATGARGRPPIRYTLARSTPRARPTIRAGLYRCRECEGSLLRAAGGRPIVAGGHCPVCGGVLEFVERRSGDERRIGPGSPPAASRRSDFDRRHARALP